MRENPSDNKKCVEIYSDNYDEIHGLREMQQSFKRLQEEERTKNPNKKYSEEELKELANKMTDEEMNFILALDGGLDDESAIKAIKEFNPKSSQIIVGKKKETTARGGQEMYTESDGKTYSLEDYEQLARDRNIELLNKHAKALADAGLNEGESRVTPYYQFDDETNYNSWIEYLTKEGSEWAADEWCGEYLLKKDYDMASWAIECYVAGKEERGEYIAPNEYYRIGYYKYVQVDTNLPLLEMRERYGGKILSAGQWYQKAIDAGMSYDDISEGSWCVDEYLDVKKKREAKQSNSKTSSSGGCYIATAIYGSYDCPEVWTLRRYRDEKLLQSVFGRVFVKVYYAFSPTVVKLFGKAEWFNRFWKSRLNTMVAKLKADGYDDSQYYDR